MIFIVVCILFTWSVQSLKGVTQRRASLQSPDLGQVLPTEVETYIKNHVYAGAQEIEPARHRLAHVIQKTQPFFKSHFPCQNARLFRSPTPPHSVHRLMPGDIDVVAAMGDSLIAGMGGSASTQIGSLIEDRGYSWGIGGEGTWRDALTLPNILRQFNPNLLGYSTGTGTAASKESWLNVAEPGALFRQMPYMARVLVSRIRKDKRIDFWNHWKMLTLMIGNNDVCSDMCYLRDPTSVLKTLRVALRQTLHYLRSNLPRTIVNVVPIADLIRFATQYDFPAVCYLPHRIFCPCLFGPRFDKKREYISKIAADIQRVTIDLVSRENFDRTDNFTVVLQPFTQYAELPFKNYSNNGSREPDLIDLAPDCFHFSQHGCAKAAKALWNNLLEPIHSKSTAWHPLETDLKDFNCPTSKQPYISTARNSL